jgi:hypothetical protein
MRQRPLSTQSGPSFAQPMVTLVILSIMIIWLVGTCLPVEESALRVGRAGDA